MTLGGPLGVIAGGVIVGAGISGTVSTAQQALNKEQKEFDYGKWGIQSGIGAAGGAIAAPISIMGGAIVGGTGGVIMSNSTKVGITIGAEALGGAAAGAGTKMISNKVEGKNIEDGVL